MPVFLKSSRHTHHVQRRSGCVGPVGEPTLAAGRILFNMAYCPNCKAAIVKDAVDCDVCGTSFGPDSWLPLDALPQSRKRASAATLIFRFGLSAVLLPLACLVLGMLITAIVPGCRCDELAGCDGCGVNRFTSILLYGGYMGGLLAILFVFPAAALLSGLVAAVNRRKA